MDDSVHGLRIRNYPNKNETAAKGLGEFLARECTKQLIIENRMKNRAFQGERMHALPAIQKQRTVGARGRRPRKEWREGRRF
jgi:hypothetical protein